ncbi:MAG: hypothetical protein ACTSQG_10675 [Promethearchaeota archaeon]
MKKKDYLSLAKKLKDEADEIIERTEILEILASFGEVYPIGSYIMGLLTAREVDILLEVENFDDLHLTYDMSREFSKIEGLDDFYFRNDFLLESEKGPKFMTWYIKFKLRKLKRWAFNIIVTGHEEASSILQNNKEIRNKINDNNRERILNLKSELCKTPDYREAFRANDIYKAVIECDINTMEEWRKWWRAKLRSKYKKSKTTESQSNE